MNDTIAEEATGIKAHVQNGGQLYADGGEELSDREARRRFRNGDAIEAPNAGAGSYRTILDRLGFHSVKVENWTSSAGDWQFRVRGGMVWQSNRYPGYGFAYSFARGVVVDGEFVEVR